MASVLELSKLVAVSYVYRYWKSISKLLRIYYVAGIIIIMLITSLGIYGFLTSAYQKSSNKIEIRDSQIKIAENKKTLFIAQLDRMNKSIESDDARINKMSDIRNQQENRVSNLYNTKSTNSARRTETQIGSTDNQIKSLNDAITNKMNQTSSINDSISYYDQKILEYKSSDVTSEIGPLKYLSDLTGFAMNKVVNMLVLLIIFVFDPMAISLLIGVNQLTMMENNGGSNNKLHEDIKIPKILKRKFKMPKFNTLKIFKKKDNSVIDVKENEFDDDNIVDENFIDDNVVHGDMTEDNVVDDNSKDLVDVFDLDVRSSTNSKIEPKKSEDYIEKIVNLDIFNIKENLRVYHSTFGKGKILKSDPNTNRTLIHFDDFGIKELNANFANLKKIEFVLKEDEKGETFIIDGPKEDEKEETFIIDGPKEDGDGNNVENNDNISKILENEYEIVEEEYVNPSTPWMVSKREVRRERN